MQDSSSNQASAVPPPSYQAVDPPSYHPATPDSLGAAAATTSSASSSSAASQHGFYITTPEAFKDFAVSDLARRNALFHLSHSTKLFRGWDTTLCRGRKGGSMVYRFRKPSFDHNVDVLDANGDVVTTLRSNADGGHDFISSDGQSTFVWNIQPLTSFVSTARRASKSPSGLPPSTQSTARSVSSHQAPPTPSSSSRRSSRPRKSAGKPREASSG